MSQSSRLVTRLIKFAVLGIILSSLAVQSALAQQATPPVDLMLIIDNSCSMYAPGTTGCGDNALGSDSDYLRVTGATLFAVRTALGEAAPQDRIGAVSMGGRADVVYGLTPVHEAREGLVAAIEEPSPKGGTNVMDALGTAYDELTQDPQAANTSAIVFLTDGVPYPSEGQSFVEIEEIVTTYDDIPLYVLLLQNQEEVVPEYPPYIQKWKDFQQRVTNVQVYEIPSAGELLDVYIQVMADIAARPGSSPPETISPGETKSFYVSRYARRVEVTAIYPDEQRQGQVEIRDASQRLLTREEEGVVVFYEPHIPVEVYIAREPRLAGQRDGDWTVTSVNARFSFFVAVQGAYGFDWLSPQATSATLPGILMLSNPVNPLSELVLEFRLMDDEDQSILEKQRISGHLEAPDGSEFNLMVPSDLTPDANGVYSLPFRVSEYGSKDATGRYELFLQSEDPKQPDPAQPIAIQRVWLQADPGVAVVVPPPPLATATTVILPSPTVSPPVTATPPIPSYTPTPDGPDGPSRIPWPLIIVALTSLGGLTVYGFLRLFIKLPKGFVVVRGRSPKPPISINKKARRKLWGWWKMTVGRRGDIRIRPSTAGDASLDMGAVSYQDDGGTRVTVPGLGDETVIAPTTQSSKRVKEKRQRRSSIFGRFYRDGERIKFQYDCEFGKGRRTLSADTVEVVNLGDVRLDMSLNRENLTDT